MKKIDQYLNKLYELERVSINYSLNNIRNICNELGNPQNNFKSIHIAGTNGKGATASFIASILTECNYKTGLFTSPHILKFNERIRINGIKIPDKYIINFINKYFYLFNKYKPSFFEICTAMAFKYFSDKKIDYAVIETGLGGRLDSTNIIKPLLSVITQIGLDHTDLLGKDIYKIAKEKSGIIKKDVDTIIADTHKELRKIFLKYNNNNIIFAEDVIQIKHIKFNNKLGFDLNVKINNDLYNLNNCIIPLNGNYQTFNASTAILSVIRILSRLNKKVNKLIFKKGLINIKKNTGYKGRFDFINKNKKCYIFDITHNLDGFQFQYKTIINQKISPLIIYGCSSDKNYKGIIPLLKQMSDQIILTKMNYKRSADPVDMFRIAKIDEKSNKEIYYSCNIKDALKMADVINVKNKNILITGSFFIVSDAIRELGFEKYYS